jgi:hypothetical protein
MNQPTSNNSVEQNLYNAIRLNPVRIAALYTLLALGNFLLYGPTPFEMLGFTDDPIGWWAMVMVLFMVAFCLLAVRIACQGCFVDTHSRLQPLRWLTIMLVVLAVLFAVPNILIAFLHLSIGIPSGFLYWGQVRAAYEVPFFHLLPMLLLLYWWLSSLSKQQAVPAPHSLKEPKGLIVACTGEEVVDPLSTVTDWLYGSILSLGAYFALAFVIVTIVQPQVVHGVDGGIRVVTDFTALSIYVISGGVLLGLLIAIGVYVYWRRRLHAMVGANAFFALHTGFICLTLWWLPLIIAVSGAIALAVYLQ